MSCGPLRVTSVPSTRITPDLGVSMPLATLRTVDLPAPFGPTRHTIVDGGTFTVSPRSTSAARP